MTAVILAGGRGTRLAPFTVSIPKPLLPLGDRPILEVVLRQLRSAGFSRVVLSLGHMAPFFYPFLDEWRALGLEITCSLEREPLGTAGPLRLIDALPSSFLVMNGDVLTTLDYRALVEAHTASGAAATIAVSRREMKVDYGVIRASAAGRLEDYDEKPRLMYDVSMGVNVVSARCLDRIPTSGSMDIPDLMRLMMKVGEPVYCHRTDCYWQDIGRFDDYERANADFLAEPGRFLPALYSR